MRLTVKKFVWVCTFIQFSFLLFSIPKKKDLNAKIEYNFLAFSFSKNEYSVIFVKKSNP